MAWSLFCIFFACSNVCNLNDEKCTTAAARKFYRNITEGGPSWGPSDNITEGGPSWGPSDPMLVDLINLDKPVANYTLYDLTLAGLSNCTVEILKFTVNQSSWEYHLQCPDLKYNGRYELNGTLYGMYVNGTGPFTANAYGVTVHLSGLFTRHVDEDGKDHLNICKYNFNTKIQSRLQIEYQNMFGGDEERTAKVNEEIYKNWRKEDAGYGQEILTPFIHMFVKNINDFLKAVPKNEIFKKP